MFFFLQTEKVCPLAPSLSFSLPGTKEVKTDGKLAKMWRHACSHLNHNYRPPAVKRTRSWRSLVDVAGSNPPIVGQLPPTWQLSGGRTPLPKKRMRTFVTSVKKIKKMIGKYHHISRSRFGLVNPIRQIIKIQRDVLIWFWIHDSESVLPDCKYCELSEQAPNITWSFFFDKNVSTHGTPHFVHKWLNWAHNRSALNNLEMTNNGKMYINRVIRLSVQLMTKFTAYRPPDTSFGKYLLTDLLHFVRVICSASVQGSSVQSSPVMHPFSVAYATQLSAIVTSRLLFNAHSFVHSDRKKFDE